MKCPRCGKPMASRTQVRGPIVDDDEYEATLCDACEDEEDEEETNDGIDERGDEDGKERGCLDPAACCFPHPFHTSDECEFHDDDQCIRDDSTECSCSRCAGAEDRFWRDQGEEPQR